MASYTYEDLIIALDLDALPDAQRGAILFEFDVFALKSALIRLIGHMNAIVFKEFSTLLDADPPGEDIALFLQERVPETEKVLEEAFDELYGDIIAVTAQ